MNTSAVRLCQADSLAEACEILAGDEDARIIAGGQTLIPMLAMRLARPSRLIDILRAGRCAVFAPRMARS